MFACLPPGNGWATRPGVGARTQGRRAVPRQSCLWSLPAWPKRTARAEVGVDPREPVCIHMVDENSLLWKKGPLALQPFLRSLHSFPLTRDSRPLPRCRTVFTCARGRRGAGVNTRVFQAPPRFSKTLRPPQRRTTQRGLRDAESYFEGRAERNGVTRPQADEGA